MEREDIEFRVSLARRLVKQSSETIEGKKTYMRKAIRMAEELRKKKQVHKTGDFMPPVRPSKDKQCGRRGKSRAVKSSPLK